MTVGDMLLLAKRLQATAHAVAIPKELEPRLTPGEISVLDYLINLEEPVRVSEIVANCHLAQSRVSTVVQSLQRRDWVEVSTPPGDRRATTVLVKREVALAAHGALSRSAAGALKLLLPDSTAAERQRIDRELTALASKLRDKANQPAKE